MTDANGLPIADDPVKPKTQPPDTGATRSLSALLPEVADSAASLQRAATAAGVKLTPVETRRSQERQNMLYQQGRTTPGEPVTWTLHSNHTPGAAVDFVANDDPTGRDPGYQWLQENAPKHGFGVLGPKDPGHVEMPGAVHADPTSAQTATPTPPAPTGIPHANVELELAKLANDAMASGADPHDVTGKLHQTISYLRQFPKMAEHANNALADGVASPADVSRTLWPHVSAMQHATGSNAPTPAEMEASGGDDTTMHRIGAVGRSFLATAANAAQGIPGMEAAEAGARSVVRRQPYADALGDIRGETSKLPSTLRTVGKLPGMVGLSAVLPGSAAASGAIIGGADEALDADPNRSLGDRALRGTLGAAAGAVIGKGVDKASVIARALYPARFGGVGSTAAQKMALEAERAQSAAQLYPAALAEGQGKEATSHILNYVNQPEIADRIAKLKELEPLKNLAPESPEMLDALYKSFSDEAKQIKKGLGALDPTKANLGRFRGQHIAERQSQLLDAMSTPGTKTVETAAAVPSTDVPAMSTAQSAPPSLRDALTNFRDRATAAFTRTQGTTEQQMARTALERHGAESSVGPLRGSPSQSAGTIPGQAAQTAEVTTPSVMPTYRQAVQDFAERSQRIDALDKGYEAVRSGMSGNLPTAKNLTRKTPEAFAEWVKTATPEQIQAARRGILGATKDALALPGKTFAPGRRAAGNAADLLRLAPTTNQTLLEGAQNLGLIGAGNKYAP